MDDQQESTTRQLQYPFFEVNFSVFMIYVKIFIMTMSISLNILIGKKYINTLI